MQYLIYLFQLRRHKDFSTMPIGILNLVRLLLTFHLTITAHSTQWQATMTELSNSLTNRISEIFHGTTLWLHWMKINNGQWIVPVLLWSSQANLQEYVAALRPLQQFPTAACKRNTLWRCKPTRQRALRFRIWAQWPNWSIIHRPSQEIEQLKYQDYHHCTNKIIRTVGQSCLQRLG